MYYMPYIYSYIGRQDSIILFLLSLCIHIYEKETFTLACFLSIESNPAILFPFVSINEPIGSQVMTSHVCFGKGSNCRTLSILSDRLSPSSF